MTTAELSRTTIQLTRRLRTLLRLNGIGNLTGGVLVPLAGVLARPTGLPSGLLAGIGVFYMVYGAAMWSAATRPRPRAAVVVALIAVNLLWAMDCVLMLATDLVHPTTLGSVALTAEAVFVTGLAALEFAAYRKSPSREL